MTSVVGARRPRFTGIRVLLVEDNHVNRLIAKGILEKTGATVIIAKNGLEALERLEHDRPIDVVLMDVQMPELDGLGATRRIRQIRGLEHLPIIAMTAQATPEERAECLAVGMTGHVAKPVDVENLLATVGAAVAPLMPIDAGREPDQPELTTAGPSGSGDAATADQTPVPASLALPGIDVEGALRRLGGSETLLLDLLRSFAADAVDLVAQLRGALQEDRAEDARQLLHLLKGEAGNVSAEEVFGFARGIESAIRENDLLTATGLLSALDREITRVANGLPPANGGAPAAGRASSGADARAPEPPTYQPVDVSAPALPPAVEALPAPAARLIDTVGIQDRATVLIVDDSRLNTQALTAILSDMCQVIAGSSGHEALSLAASHNPDLILLDVMMPGLDGYQVCSRLKNDPATASIPLIFVTAMDEEEDEARGLELGAIDYFTKPLKAPIVRARVRNHLELKRYRNLLENLSIKDALTGIANRRRLDEVLNHEWRRALRSPAPLSFILMDIDCFKAYNDNHGHTAGDECLRRVARALAGATRRFTDLVARYGGEEFACVLPATDGPGAANLGNRLRAVIEGLHIPHGHSPVSEWVTISIGVSTVLPTAKTEQGALTENADRHLYEAKRAGRNRVVTD